MPRRRRGPITDPDLRRVMALAEPSRWAIVRLLGHGPRTVGEVARAVGLSLAVVSRHLQRLRTVGIVTARREGKNLVCALAMREGEAGRWLGPAPGGSEPTRSPRPARRRPSAAPPPRAPVQAPAPRRDLDDFLL